MDDIFDSLIYIIIALVAFAISIIGKKKKKDASKIHPANSKIPNQSKEKPFLANLGQLLNDELGVADQNFQNEYIENPVIEEEIEIEEKPEIEKTPEILDSVPPEMLDDKEDIPYSIEYDDTSEIFSKSIKDAEISSEEKEPILEDFNLQDAIIYSEIINRKEY